MSASKNCLAYYHRIQPRGTGTLYGPSTHEFTTEVFAQTTVQSYEFCHAQNSESRSNTTEADIEVGGVLKAFNIGLSASTSFSSASEKANQTGREITEFQDEYVKTISSSKYTLEAGQFLSYYILVDVYCYTVNGGSRQFVHVPGSDVFCQPMNEDEMKRLAQSSILFEASSWRAVASRYNIELDNINSLKYTLTPVAIGSDPLVAMGKVTIQSVTSKKYLNGRNTVKGNEEVYIGRKENIYTEWTIEKYDGLFSFKSVSSGYYLDGRNSNYKNMNGALLVTNRNPRGDHYLQWKVESNNQGKYELKSVSSGLYINGRNSNYHTNQVWLTDTDSSDHLRWTIVKSD